MKQATQPNQPIGYWLKQADNLLTEQINKVQSANGVSRFDWQVLNRLNELGMADRKQLFEVMRTFITEVELEEILSSLTQRGWVEQGKVSHNSAAEFHLTEEGRRQHAIILASQKEVRAQAMQGIGEEEYATVIRVLQRIVSNLGGNSAGQV